MPLGMEVGLGPGDFVFDGYPAPQRAQPHPIFGPDAAYCCRLSSVVCVLVGLLVVTDIAVMESRDTSLVLRHGFSCLDLGCLDTCMSRPR